jgi:hypothetical protein
VRDRGLCLDTRVGVGCASICLACMCFGFVDPPLRLCLVRGILGPRLLEIAFHPRDPLHRFVELALQRIRATEREIRGLGFRQERLELGFGLFRARLGRLDEATVGVDGRRVFLDGALEVRDTRTRLGERRLGGGTRVLDGLELGLE